MTRMPEPSEIIRHSEHKISLTLDVGEDLAFFPGHFPQQSVLPGVVMVDWAVSFAERYLPVRVDFRTMEAIKFKQVIRPPQRIALHLEYKPETGKLSYKIDSAHGEHSSGRISRVSEVAGV